MDTELIDRSIGSQVPQKLLCDKKRWKKYFAVYLLILWGEILSGMFYFPTDGLKDEIKWTEYDFDEVSKIWFSTLQSAWKIAGRIWANSQQGEAEVYRMHCSRKPRRSHLVLWIKGPRSIGAFKTDRVSENVGYLIDLGMFEPFAHIRLVGLWWI